MAFDCGSRRAVPRGAAREWHRAEANALRPSETSCGPEHTPRSESRRPPGAQYHTTAYEAAELFRMRFPFCSNERRDGADRRRRRAEVARSRRLGTRHLNRSGQPPPIPLRGDARPCKVCRGRRRANVTDVARVQPSVGCADRPPERRIDRPAMARLRHREAPSGATRPPPNGGSRHEKRTSRRSL